MTTDTRPAYAPLLCQSLAWRESARSWTAGAAKCEAVGLLDLCRRHAERAIECERKADAWQAEAFGVMVKEWEGEEPKWP